MAFIDGTVVNVALPALQQDLNATVMDVQWVVESYALFLASLLLVGGALGDHFGRRRIYAIGIALFAISSLGCAIARDVNQLILWRAVQGIGGALLVPGSLAIISSSFGEDRRGQAIGTWSGFTAITAAVGPVAGGWLVENVSWRSVFYINIPLAAIVLFLLFWRVPESRDTESNELDWWGSILVTTGLGLLVYGLIESSRFGFGNMIVISTIIAGIILLLIFLVVESRIPNPMLPLRLFRLRNFRGSNLLTFFLYAALGGALFFFPLNLIQVQGYTATAAGAAFLPFILIMFLLSRWSGGLIHRHGPRLPLIIGPLIAAAGFALFALPEVSGNYWSSFFPAIIVLGLGMAVSVAPLTTTVMNSVHSNQSGIASGVNNAVSRAAGLLAVAIFGIVMLRIFSYGLEDRLEGIPLSRSTRVSLHAERVKLAGMQLPQDLDIRTRQELRGAVTDSFVFSFRIVMLMAAGLSAASAVSAFLLIQNQEALPSLER